MWKTTQFLYVCYANNESNLLVCGMYAEVVWRMLLEMEDEKYDFFGPYRVLNSALKIVLSWEFQR